MKIDDIPIVGLKHQLYFMGLYKVHIELKGDFLTVKVGQSSYERLPEYLKQNRTYFKRCLTLLHLKNDELNLVEVVNKLIL